MVVRIYILTAAIVKMISERREAIESDLNLDINKFGLYPLEREI